MSLKVSDEKRRIKRSTVPGQKPTIPLSSDHTDGTWIVTDIYIGEEFLNQVDDRKWVRTESGIHEIGLFPTGSTSPLFSDMVSVLSADVLTLNSIPIDVLAAPGAGLAYVIESATVQMTSVTIAYATNTQLELLTDTASIGQMVDTSILPSIVSRAGIAPIQTLSSTSNTQVITDKKVQLLVRGAGDPTAGDGDLDVWFNYRIVAI